MSTSDMTAKILREIRDEIRHTRVDLGTKIDATNERVDSLDQHVRHLGTEMGRMASALTDLATQQVMLGRHVRNVTDRHENRIDELSERLTKVEARTARSR